MGKQDQGTPARADMSANTARLIAAAALFAGWMALVLLGRADALTLVDFIKYALGGLAAHAITQGSKTP